MGGTSHKLKPKECACLAGSCPLGTKLTRQIWFSLCYYPAYNEMLWKWNVQAVRRGEVQTRSSTLKSVYALKANVC